MSYILDALKKSDQQRQRGATPTLRSAPPIEVAPTKKTPWAAIGLAVFLLLCGLAIGWLRPWQAGTSSEHNGPTPSNAPATSEPITTGSAASSAPAATTATPGSAVVPGLTLAETATPMPATPHAAVPQVASAAPAASSAASAAVATQTPSASSGAAPTEHPPAMPESELPPALRQELPALKISLHAYARLPAKRLVSINDQLLHEGDTVAPGLTIEEITPDGMVLNFRGTRFRHGVQ